MSPASEIARRRGERASVRAGRGEGTSGPPPSAWNARDRKAQEFSSQVLGGGGGSRAGSPRDRQVSRYNSAPTSFLNPGAPRGFVDNPAGSVRRGDYASARQRKIQQDLGAGWTINSSAKQEPERQSERVTTLRSNRKFDNPLFFDG